MSVRSVVLLAVVAGSTGCEPKPGALNNQTLGLTTGLFSEIPSANAFCNMLNIQGVSMDILFILKDENKDTLNLALMPLGVADVHAQFQTSFRYGAVGEAAAARVDIERGHELVNPELEGDVAKQAAELRTNLYFPLYVHTVKVEAAHLCNADAVSGDLDRTDCVDVPESSISDSRLWCSIGANVGPEWTK